MLPRAAPPCEDSASMRDIVRAGVYDLVEDLELRRNLRMIEDWRSARAQTAASLSLCPSPSPNKSVAPSPRSLHLTMPLRPTMASVCLSPPNWARNCRRLRVAARSRHTPRRRGASPPLAGEPARVCDGGTHRSGEGRARLSVEVLCRRRVEMHTGDGHDVAGRNQRLQGVEGAFFQASVGQPA